MTASGTLWRSVRPAPYPEPSQYARCYCEENTYLLLRHLVAFAHQSNRAASQQQRKQLASNPGAAGNGSGARSHVLLPVWDVQAIFVSNQHRTVLLWEQCASRAAPAERSPVIWDYHVFAALTCTLVAPCDGAVEHELSPRTLSQLDTGTSSSSTDRTRTWVYDPDSRLSYAQPEGPYEDIDPSLPPRPIPLQEYLEQTFSPASVQAGRIPPGLRICARIVPATHFLAHFASDRSHMILPNADPSAAVQWSAPPPPWPLIVGPKARAAGTTTNLMQRYVSVSPSDACYGEVLHDLAFFRARWTLTLPPGSSVASAAHDPDHRQDATTPAPAPAPAPAALKAKRSVNKLRLRRTLSLPSKARHCQQAVSPPPASPLPPLPSSSPFSSSLSASSATKAAPPSANQTRTPPQISQPASVPVTPDRKGQGARRGGRVSSPLFPAYLAASSQNRARSPSPPPLLGSKASGAKRQDRLVVDTVPMTRSVSLGDTVETTRRRMQQ